MKRRLYLLSIIISLCVSIFVCANAQSEWITALEMNRTATSGTALPSTSGAGLREFSRKVYDHWNPDVKYVQTNAHALVLFVQVRIPTYEHVKLRLRLVEITSPDGEIWDPESAYDESFVNLDSGAETVVPFSLYYPLPFLQK